MSERSAINCEQFSLNAESIEKESGYFIDTINQQELLFKALKDFGRRGKGSRQLEVIVRALKEFPQSRCKHLAGYLEKFAEAQVRFAEKHKNLQKESEMAESQMVLPKNPIDRYHFYLACLRSIID